MGDGEIVLGDRGEGEKERERWGDRKKGDRERGIERGGEGEEERGIGRERGMGRERNGE